MSLSFNFRQNIRNMATKENAKAALEATLAAVPYTLPATLLGLSGPTGMITSIASALGVAILLGSKPMLYGSAAIAAQHALYVFGSGTINDVTGKAPWTYSGQTYVGDTLQPGAAYATLPDGSQVVSYSADTDTPGVSDFLMPEQAAAMQDFLLPGQTLNDDAYAGLMDGHLVSL